MLEPAGYEVAEQGGRFEGQLERVQARLAAALGGDAADWSDRLRVVPEDGGIPFPDHSFDLVLSNQVLEHVRHLDSLFREVRRVLAPDGVSVHVFPAREVWIEPHVGLPLVHRCRDWESARVAIHRLSRLGLGRWRRHGRDREAFAEWWADFQIRFVHYRSASEILRHARSCGLRARFAHDGYAYRDRLGRLLGSGPSTSFPYRRRASLLARPLFHWLTRRLGPTTLVLSPPQSPLDADV
jgi:SAM-dependent methyltransferase